MFVLCLSCDMQNAQYCCERLPTLLLFTRLSVQRFELLNIFQECTPEGWLVPVSL